MCPHQCEPKTEDDPSGWFTFPFGNVVVVTVYLLPFWVSYHSFSIHLNLKHITTTIPSHSSDYSPHFLGSTINNQLSSTMFSSTEMFLSFWRRDLLVLQDQEAFEAAFSVFFSCHTTRYHFTSSIPNSIPTQHQPHNILLLLQASSILISIPPYIIHTNKPCHQNQTKALRKHF